MTEPADDRTDPVAEDHTDSAVDIRDDISIGDGTDTPAATVSLSVPDMDCTSCAAKIESGLTRHQGVLATDLHPTTGIATVTFDTGEMSRDEVIAAITGVGYEVTNRDESIVEGGSARRAEGEPSGARDTLAANGEPVGTDASDQGQIAPPSAVWTSTRGIKTWIGAIFLTVGLLLRFAMPAWDLSLATTSVITRGTEFELVLTLADAAFIAAILASGIPVVRSGYYSARARSLDIDLLMGTAIIAASAVGLFIEAATLAVLFSIAELLERFAMDRTRNSLRSLLELAPNEATVIRDDGQETVPVEAVVVGDRLAVRPGEQIPVDGVVTHGSSAVDQSPITGESIPVDKVVGDEVFAGTLNEVGYLEISARATAGASTLSRIIDLVQNAQAKQTKTEQFVDRFAGYYTPMVVVFALLTAVVPPLLIDGTATVGLAGLSHTFVGDRITWFVRGLTLLVIACPCAFVISTPVSVASGVTAAARNGVLIKGGNHLEAMGGVDAIAFDKTGTLTTGVLTVTDVVPVDNSSDRDEKDTDDSTAEEAVLQYAGALEQRSEHPIAEAILHRIDEMSGFADVSGSAIDTSENSDGGMMPSVVDFKALPGKGITGRIDGETYYAGKPGLFAEFGHAIDPDGSRTDGGAGSDDFDAESSDPAVAAVEPSNGRYISSDHEIRKTIQTLQREGKTVVVVGTTDRILGLIGIADTIRPGAKRVIDELHRLDVAPLVMLTGDNEGTARGVAAELGIDEYRAELLPDEKVTAVEELAAEHGDVAMVGDGVNDAPALATATVGIAMGAAGTDTAIETADIALMGDDIGKLPYLYALSHSANDVIRQNIWSSLGVKLVLAVGVPFGYVSVAAAVVVGDMGMSLGVTGNAMRLARIAPERVGDE